MTPKCSVLHARTPFVGCSFCVYELPPGGRGPTPVVPRATLAIQTPRGVRLLCDAHAASGTWRA